MSLLDKIFGLPSKDKFARLVADAIEKAGETSPLRYDASEFRLLVEGEERHFLNLGNLYQEYCLMARGKRREGVRNFVRIWFSHRKGIPADFDDVRPDLLPIVRNRSYFEFARLQLQIDGLDSMDWPHRGIADDLAVGLAYDLPEAMCQVQQQNLEDWKITFEEALEVACANLREISLEAFQQAARGVWRSPWRDNYDVARLLLHDVIRSVAVSGEPVVMLPNRDTLLIAGSDDADALSEMAAMVETALEGPRSLNGLAFLLDRDKWRSFLPHPEHVLFETFKLLQVKSTAQDYSEQKELLEALHKKSGEDLFVASYLATQDSETGRVQSHCVWSQGVDTLLPRTDRIFFFVGRDNEDGEIVATSDWQRVQTLIGHMMKLIDMYPVRYRVKDFPSAEELQAIR